MPRQAVVQTAGHGLVNNQRCRRNHIPVKQNGHTPLARLDNRPSHRREFPASKPSKHFKGMG